MFYASWINPINLDFAFVWRFIVDSSFVLLHFPVYLPVAMWNFAVFWNDDLARSTKCSFWVDFSAWANRGWILVPWLWTHFHPYLDTVPPMVGKHLRQTAERGVERMNFFQMPNLHVLLTGPGTYSSPNFESRKELLISGSFGMWEIERVN